MSDKESLGVVVRIEQWSVGVDEGTGLDAPEMRPPRLRGTVYGHPRKDDGSKVITSPITRADGRRVTTRSGTVYQLGEPAPEYIEYVHSLGRVIDPVEPVKVFK